MMKCYYCKGPVRQERVQVVREWKGKTVVIENVPADVCQKCGERFFLGWVAAEMDRLIQCEEPTEREVRLPVLTFAREVVA